MSPPTLLQSKPHESGAFFCYYSLRSRDTRLAPRMGLAALAGYSACASHETRFARGILGLRSRDTRCARKIEDHVNQVDFLGGE